MMPSCKCVARGLAFLLIVFPLAVQATPTDRIIIKVSETMRPMVLAGGGPAPRARERVSALSAAVGHEVVYLRAMSGGADVVRLPRAMPLEQVQAMAEAMARLPGVEYAEPDIRIFPATLPNDTRFGDQWNLMAVSTTAPVNYGIDAPGAWVISTGEPVTVAVLDTGILDHLDLQDKILPGYDFFDRDDDPSDPGDYVTEEEATLACPETDSSWHGTHVSGTIAAATNNAFGVAGISWSAKILPVRVLGKCGGNPSDIADAMRWAVGLAVPGVDLNPNPARILNLSLGGRSECGQTFQNAIRDVNATGAVIVVAAGNAGRDLSQTPVSPAVCPGVVTVAASNRQGDRARYTSYGNAVNISAPGGDCIAGSDPCQTNEAHAILSTLDGGEQDPIGDNGIGIRIGTSMAAPHVSGVIALMLSVDPTLTREELSYLLRTSVTPFPESSTCETEGGCGWGIVNAAHALQATLDFEGLPPPPSGSGGGGLIGLPWLLFLGGYLLGFICITRLTTPRTTPASAP